MAENNDYTSGLMQLMGNVTQSQPQPQSPSQEIGALYDNQMADQPEQETTPLGISGVIEGNINQGLSVADQQAFSRYIEQQAAQKELNQQYAGFNRIAEVPNQQIITDPNALIGSTGERFKRSIWSGTGMLIESTGQTLDYINAKFNPSETDGTTSIGDYLKKKGSQLQNDNLLVLSEDLKDFTWEDIFKGEFWSSSISQQLPYALSFLIPYTAGARIAVGSARAVGLAKGTTKALRAAQKSGKFGTMGKGVTGSSAKGQAGSGLLQYLGRDLGKKGVQKTLLRNLTGFAGGGLLANLSEGAMVAGEHYDELINMVGEDGQPMFTPQEAAESASGVVKDNLRYWYVDALQYGILFGGAGRGIMSRLLKSPVAKTKPGATSQGLIQNVARRAGGGTLQFLKATGQALPYAGIEGITEGYQEVYQEWIKHKAKQNALGLDVEPMTEWLREAPFGEKRPELRKMFWSGLALGGAMGQVRGYFDIHAERQAQIDKKADAYNNAIDIFREAMKDPNADLDIALQNTITNLLASELWHYGGDGSVAMSVVDNYVADGIITEEQGVKYKEQIEQAEKDYAKHHVNTTLTEAGAESAFYNEMKRTRLQEDINRVNEKHSERIENLKKNIKDPKKLEEAIQVEEAARDEALKEAENQMQQLNDAIERLYTAQIDNRRIAKSTGKADKRFKQTGLEKTDFEKFTQEGEQQKQKRESEEAQKRAEEEAAKPRKTLRQTLTEVGTKAVQTAKDVGAAAVKGVRGVVDRVTKPASEREATTAKQEVEETVEKINNLTNKEITPSAKKKLIEALENGNISVQAAKQIKGTGRGGTINNRDVSNAIRKDARKQETTTEESQEDVKKKDQPTVAPKSEQYKKTEEALKGKGIKPFVASISKLIGKQAGAFSYVIKAAAGNTIKFFAKRNVDIQKYTREAQNITLRLVSPVSGQPNVVEVDGKLYFQFKNNGPLYESKIEVVADGTVIGELEQTAQEFYQDKGPTRKAKKKDKRTIDRLVKGVKEAKQNIIKFFTRSQKDLPNFTPTEFTGNPLYRQGAGIGENAILKKIVDKKFPGAVGVLTYSKLIDGYGQEASSLAIGSTLFINIDSVAQTDIIHEAGHIYYGLMEDTPLMKRIKKLLPKSALYSKTKQDYPELILMRFKGRTATLGEFYRNIINNTDSMSENDIISIANNLSQAIKEEDNTRINELFISLRTQLKANGATELRASQQAHVLEETFTRTLEAYSRGTVDAVIKGSAAQKRLEEDLIKFYKEVKKLTNDEDARQILNLTVKDIASLDLENAMKAVLLNFGSDKSTLPRMRNSAYGPIGKASKKPFTRNTSYSAVSFYISEYIGANRTVEEITDNVMQAIADDSNLSIKDDNVQRTRNYIAAVIAQIQRPKQLQQADKILDRELAKIGVDLKSKEDVTEEIEDPNDINTREEKDIALPKTTTNFVKKLVEIHNNSVEEEGRIDAKKVLAALMSVAKATKENPMDFANEVRRSTNEALLSIVNVLDRVYGGDQVLTNAKLIEIKGPIEGITIETLAHNVLTIQNETERYWSRYESTSATVEKSVVDGIVKSINNNKDVIKEVVRVYNTLFQDKNPGSSKDRYDAAKAIFQAILSADNKGVLIDIDSMLNQTMIYKGKRQSVPDILFDNTINKFGNPDLKNKFIVRHISKKKGFADEINNRKVLGTFHGNQSDIRTILTHGVIASRATNYLSMVDNVDMDGVSIFNKENGLRNRADNVERIFNEDIQLDKNDIMHHDNNIYSLMALRNKNKDGKKTFHFTIHSGLMRRLINKASGIKNKDNRTKKFTDINPDELVAADFFMFLNRYNDGIKNNEKVIRYDQPIAVFSDKSRRYYVESIAAHNPAMRKLLLSKIENNPAYKAKYKNGDRVFPYDIANGKIKQMPQLLERWREYANKNKELFKNNNALKKGVFQEGAVEAFLTSYIANKFMAQQLFVHDHRQSKDQVDYIKRAAGAIASHTVFDRNTTVEFVVTKDYYETKAGDILTEDQAKKQFGDNWKDNVAIENDAMGYVLPEEAKMIRARYGESQNVGNVFKFVYHYTQLEGPQKGRTTYMKFAVHTLTPELEAKSEYLKNIGDVLRTRRDQIREDSKGGIVIAASESAAKLYSGADRVIHDISEGYDIDNIMTIQDEIYRGDGKYVGLSGEGFGIQLELDKETDERFFPSQLFYNLATNIAPEEQATLNAMLELRQRVMEENNASRNASLIMNDKGTELDVIKERDSFKSSVSADIFDVLVDNTYENLDPRYPYLNAVHNSIAAGRITNKGTKMYTKGSIGYQSASLGMGLKFYEKGLFAADPSIVASEAIVPGYLQDQGVKVGDLFIGTRVPAHGKVSSAVFVVKDFHKKIGDTPTSNVTIPSWVSKYWGADLDGDSIHMNFKYTPEEVSEKSWRKLSNDFFDAYVKLISRSEKEGEIQADIDFEKDAEAAIAKVFKGKKQDSQLEPTGDGQMFADNVPAKNLVGMIASLMRSFNVFSNSRDALPFKITIKGEKGAVTQDKFYDDATAENGVGNWYGVAQLLNIALDNAKHQYASKLGMDMQSVFSYVMLRRLGYSLNDLAVLYNSDIVKSYMDFKRNSSSDYVSRDSDIKDMFIEKDSINENQLLKFAKQEKLGTIDIKKFVKDGEVSLDLSKLNTLKEKQKAVLMLYALDRYKKFAVDPISKAFTVHQTIEKNPLELKKIRDGIQQAQGVVNIPMIGKTGFTYTFTDQTKNNFIIDHATKLFDSVLQRAERTDVRYSPYMQRILTIPASLDRLNEIGELKAEVVNQVIVNNIKEQFTFLNDVKSETVLVQQFQALKDSNPDNAFLRDVIEVGERKGQKYIVMNRAKITEFTSYKAIEQYKQAFGQLSEAEQNLIFEIEYAFNRFGLSGGAGKASSFVPFFNDEYVEKINSAMSILTQDNQNKQPDFSKGPVPQELENAIADVKRRQSGVQNMTPAQKTKMHARENNNIVLPKAKKVIPADQSYNGDYLGGDVEVLSFDEFLRDKGIDPAKLNEEDQTLKGLQDQYTAYLNQLRTVREFEETLTRKPLSEYTIEGLYDLARDFGRFHAAASKGIRYKIEREIGQKAFQDQAKYLRDVGASKGYTYNIPGVDGTPQQDLTNFQAWLGSNNMTSNRPEIQYLINEANKQYRKYMRSFKEHKRLLDEKRVALERSKDRGLSILERISGVFDRQSRYRYIYGNIATVENGKVRLFTEQEIAERGVDLSKEEEEYYIRYKALGEVLLSAHDGKANINAGQLGTLESMTRSGLFGLYSTSIDAQDYYRVRVLGTDKNGNKVYKTFYEWKFEVYKGRTSKLTLDSGREIFELEKLRRKAKDFKSKGRHEDGEKIMLSDMEYDALVNNGDMMRRLLGSKKLTALDQELIQEYERRKGVKAQNVSFDINSAMLDFMRGHIFYNGDGQYKLEDGQIVKRDDRFTGMGDLAVLTDSIIAFNKNLDNKNAVKYLTGWWKEGFLTMGQTQESAVGKTGDKVIDFFVRLTSLRLLGLNMSVGIGNLLAGKYQELRKRGGKQFILGESRYWRNLKKSREILKDKRIVEYSFDEFIHLAEQSGPAKKIEKLAYIFMDYTEDYIQGAAFLGMLTEQEFNNPDTITEERVMQINSAISTLHGEGYTAIDASLLSMYSYGRALLQFKKWFVTLFKDRFSAEDIDRFGDVNIGSYRASADFVTDLFRRYFAGDITKKEIMELYNKTSDQRKAAIRAHARGLGIGLSVLSLIAILEDDDDPDVGTLKTLKKFSNDIFVTTDIRRFVDYTIVPASIGTAKNASKAVMQAASGEKTQRRSEYADRGESKALKTFMNEVSPLSEFKKQIARLGED